MSAVATVLFLVIFFLSPLPILYAVDLDNDVYLLLPFGYSVAVLSVNGCAIFFLASHLYFYQYEWIKELWDSSLFAPFPVDDLKTIMQVYVVTFIMMLSMLIVYIVGTGCLEKIDRASVSNSTGSENSEGIQGDEVPTESRVIKVKVKVSYRNPRSSRKCSQHCRKLRRIF